MDLELCFLLLQEMYLYKLQNNFALLLVVIVHFVMQYISISVITLMSHLKLIFLLELALIHSIFKDNATLKEEVGNLKPLFFSIMEDLGLINI